MDYLDRITIEPDKRAGKPCIRGLRITVYDVLDYLAAGMTDAQILADFPDLAAEDIKACLTFAADRGASLSHDPGRVKLLFDQNLSHHLIERLADVFPGSQHVRQVSLERATDQMVWDYAAAHGFTIVSKDSGFHQRSFVYGHPPKVIWLRLSNYTTDDVERLLRHASMISLAS